MRRPVEGGRVQVLELTDRSAPLLQRAGVLRLSRELSGKRFEDRAVAVLVRVVEQSVITVAVVVPTRVIQDWIQTDAFDGHAGRPRGEHFLADVSKPRGPCLV